MKRHIPTAAPRRKPAATPRRRRAATSDAREASVAPVSSSAIEILIVDDDPDCRLLLRDAIAECRVSCHIHECSNGGEALDRLHRRGKFHDAPRPALVYLDIEMPGMDGQEVLRRIKADPDLRSIPVVMMTGVCEEKHMRLAAESGANSYTLKSADPQKLLQTVLSSTRYWLTTHQHAPAQPKTS